jgi:hypothetical protein
MASGSDSRKLALIGTGPLFCTRSENATEGTADAFASHSSKGENMVTDADTPFGALESFSASFANG